MPRHTLSPDKAESSTAGARRHARVLPPIPMTREDRQVAKQYHFATIRKLREVQSEVRKERKRREEWEIRQYVWQEKMKYQWDKLQTDIMAPVLELQEQIFEQITKQQSCICQRGHTQPQAPRGSRPSQNGSQGFVTHSAAAAAAAAANGGGTAIPAYMTDSDPMVPRVSQNPLREIVYNFENSVDGKPPLREWYELGLISMKTNGNTYRKRLQVYRAFIECDRDYELFFETFVGGDRNPSCSRLAAALTSAGVSSAMTWLVHHNKETGYRITAPPQAPNPPSPQTNGDRPSTTSIRRLSQTPQLDRDAAQAEAEAASPSDDDNEESNNDDDKGVDDDADGDDDDDGEDDGDDDDDEDDDMDADAQVGHGARFDTSPMQPPMPLSLVNNMPPNVQHSHDHAHHMHSHPLSSPGHMTQMDPNIDPSLQGPMQPMQQDDPNGGMNGANTSQILFDQVGHQHYLYQP